MTAGVTGGSCPTPTPHSFTGVPSANTNASPRRVRTPRAPAGASTNAEASRREGRSREESSGWYTNQASAGTWPTGGGGSSGRRPPVGAQGKFVKAMASIPAWVCPSSRDGWASTRTSKRCDPAASSKTPSRLQDTIRMSMPGARRFTHSRSSAAKSKSSGVAPSSPKKNDDG